MALTVDRDTSVRCTECSDVLPSQAALEKHKGDMIIGGRGHTKCLDCNALFITTRGYYLHRRMKHSAEQDLRCPGCGAHFARIGPFLGHILSDCEVLGREGHKFIKDQREASIHMARGLQSLDEAAKLGIQLGPGKTRADYGDYLNCKNTAFDLTEAEMANVIVRDYQLQAGADLNLEADFPALPKASATATLSNVTSTNQATGPTAPSFRSSVDDYLRGDSKQPDLLTAENLASLPTKGNPWADCKTLFPNGQAASNLPTASKASTISTPPTFPKPPGNTYASAVNMSKTVFPNARAAVRPTPAQIIAINKPARTLENAWDDHDPSNPRFNIQKYYVPIISKFKCPIPGCTKSFPKAAGLKAHLQSDTAHSKDYFMCPQCNKFFKTIPSLAHHAESQSLDCTVQYSESYGEFLHQLTGGVLELGGEHADGTPIYVVSDKAMEVLGTPQKLTAREQYELFCEANRAEQHAKKAAAVASKAQW